MNRKSALLSLTLAALLGSAPAAAHNNALAFDGVDDFVEVVGLPAPSNTSAVTIEFWNFVRSSDLPKQAYAFAFTTDNQEIRTSAHAPWPDGKLYWDCGNPLQNGRLTTNYRPYLDRWTHIALVSAGKGGKFMGIYLDGKLVASKQLSEGPSKDLVHLLIGTSADRRFHTGRIDEFRVWNRVRTAAEIQRDMRSSLLGDEPGLVAYFNFDYGRPDLRTVPNRVDGGPAGQLRGFALTGTRSNYVLSGAALSDYAGLTPGTTSQSTLEAFYASNGGKTAFNEQYRKALSTMLLVQDDVVHLRYAEAQKKLDSLWGAYPKSTAGWWNTPGCAPGGPCAGAPVAYAGLRMLEDVVSHGLATGPPAIGRNQRLTIVLAGCSKANKPATVADLRNGTGTPVQGRILPDLTANDNRILRQSVAVFRDYAHAITGGRIHLDVGVVSLPQVCLQVTSSYEDGQPPTAFVQPGDLGPIWAALPARIIDATDWWWVLYPSQVPENVRLFANTVFITGGMGGLGGEAPHGGPIFIVDDRWLTRRPPHLGTGPFTDVERRAWLPQWLQHEFFHFLFGIYPSLGLEATGHQWQTQPWPADFVGKKANIEVDYYEESLRKRLQTAKAQPPLSAALRFAPPTRSEWAVLSPANLVGSYQTENPVNSFLKGKISLQAGRLRWDNEANVGWSLTPVLAKGRLTNGRLATGPENPYRAESPNFEIVPGTDAAGNVVRKVLGFRFGGILYKKL